VKVTIKIGLKFLQGKISRESGPTMTTHWQTIQIEEAQQHPLYGFGGWLIVFSVSMTLGMLSALGTINGEAHRAGITLSEFFSIEHPAVSYTKFVLGFQALILTIIYWLLFSKHSSFRNITSILLATSWPITALIGLAFPFPSSGSALIASVIPWLLSCAVWITYLQRSKRVRVTFERAIQLKEKDRTTGNIDNKEHIDRYHAHSQKNVYPVVREVSEKIKVPDKSGTNTRTDIDEENWEQALNEFEGKDRRLGVWAKCFAQSEGDEVRAKAEYLKIRAAEFAMTRCTFETTPLNGKEDSVLPASSSMNFSSIVKPQMEQTPVAANEAKPIPRLHAPLNGDAARKAALQLGYNVYVEDAGLFSGYRYIVQRGGEQKHTFDNESTFVRWARDEIKLHAQH